jgi:hypothetical protein
MLLPALLLLAHALPAGRPARRGLRRESDGFFLKLSYLFRI